MFSDLEEIDDRSNASLLEERIRSEKKSTVSFIFLSFTDRVQMLSPSQLLCKDRVPSNT